MPLAGAQPEPFEMALLLESGPVRLLLDAGANRQPRWIDALTQAPDLLILTHAHADHIGALPALLQRFPGLRVLCSPTTARLLKPALHALLGRKQASRAGAIARRCQRLPFAQPLELADLGLRTGLRLELLPAGHIPGACAILLTDPQGRRLLYSGDICTADLPLTPAAQLGPRAQGVDLLLLEGSLAGAQRFDSFSREDELQRILRRCRAHQGPRLLAASAIGELSELACALIEDGQAIAAQASAQPILRACAAIDSQELLTQCTLLEQREALHHLRAGGLLIAAGDQLQRGSPARALADRLQANPQALFVLVNALRRKSHARRLLQKSQRGQLPAAIDHLQLPLHATRPELVELARSLAPSALALVHGRLEALHATRRAMQDASLPCTVTVPDNGQWIEVP